MRFKTVFTSLGDTFETEFQNIQEVTVGTIKVDDTLSLESENPVQNKVISAEINKKAEKGGYEKSRIMGTDETGELKPYGNGNAIEVENNVVSVKTVMSTDEGGTLPMSAAGVEKIVGNIDALLQTI